MVIKSETVVFYTNVVVVAEWLRRWTRNPLGSPSAGSNPAHYVESVVLIVFSLKLLSLESSSLLNCNIYTSVDKNKLWPVHSSFQIICNTMFVSQTLLFNYFCRLFM